MSKNIKWLATLLCITALLCLFVACGGDKGETETKAEQTQAQAESLNQEGQTFTEESAPSELQSEQQTLAEDNTEFQTMLETQNELDTSMDIGNETEPISVETKAETETIVEEETEAVTDAPVLPSSEGLAFELNDDDKSYTCVGIGTCTDTDIVISTYENLPVTSIGDRAFSGNPDITSITLGSAINNIGQQAFLSCSNLKSIHIYDIAKFCEIEWNAGRRLVTLNADLYLDQTLIVDLVIPHGVTHINDYAFANIKSLKSVSIPSTVKSIGTYAFLNSKNNSFESIYIQDLASWCEVQQGENAFPDHADAYVDNALVVDLVIPQGVTRIGDYAFHHQLFKHLKSVDIPNSVETIGAHAFEGCLELTSLSLPNSIISVGSYAFNGCSGLKDIRLSQNLTTIEGYAFANCTRLISITIPKSVTTMEGFAFRDCYNLVSVTFFSKPSVQINGYSKLAPFYGCIKLVEIVDNVNDPPSAGYWLKNLISTISTDVMEVHAGDSKLAKLNGFLFYTYNDVNYLIGYEGSDTDITLPQSYNNEPYVIYQNAFYQCSEMTGITIGEKATEISQLAFSNCDQLTKIVVDEGNPIYLSGGYNCIIEKASNTLVLGCAGSIIPDGITTIGDNAFSGCSGVTHIVIPDSVTTIGYEAFYGCDKLETVNIGKGVEIIGNSAFKYCTSLKNIIIPQNVKSIESDAFYQCNKLESVTILNPTIELYSSFDDDSETLKDVYFAGTEEEWANIEMCDDGAMIVTGLHRYGVTIHYNYTPD